MDVDGAPAGRRHREGWRLGTLLGVPVLVARSWFVIAAVITFLFAPTVLQEAPALGGLAYLVAFLYALLLFASVLVHEVSHAAASRAFGLPAKHIVINLWGGHTQFENDVPSPGRSFVVAVVGPLSNGLLAVAAVPVWLATRDVPVVSLLVYAFAFLNAVVALFNLVPGLPLDGGRILEAAVWKVTGQRTTGTIAAGWVGRVVAALLLLWFVVRPLLSGVQISLVQVAWAGVIAALLWAGAGQAIRTAGIRRRAPQATVAGLVRRATVVPRGVSIADAMAAAGAGHPADLAWHPVLLVDGPEAPPGVLDASAVSEVPVDRRPLVPASAAARSLPPSAVVGLDLAGEELLRALSSLPGEEWVVRDADGRWVGLLRGSDVVAAVVGTRRPATGTPRP